MHKGSNIDPLFAFEMDGCNGQKWLLKEASPAQIQSIKHKTGINDLLARILVKRGVSADTAHDYINPKIRNFFPDPFSFLGMKKAAQYVLDIIRDGGSVTIFADYDVDGGTSAALLRKYFSYWGRDVTFYVPDRVKEGFGPSPEAFRTIKSNGANLVITVDCGAAAIGALQTAREIDLPVIVIDHHLMTADCPDTVALINPNQPGDDSGQGHLAAVGVVFVFLAAMNALARARDDLPKTEGELPNLLEWLDLVALGTICDMSPLTGVNRAFVRQGLKVLGQGRNIGLRALSDVSGITVADTVYQVGFVLGPRLNAGGRVGEPWLASNLLASEDPKEALIMAERLHILNDARKTIEAACLEQAIAQAEKQFTQHSKLNCLVIAGEGWHPGILGIVAGRIKDRFNLPTVIIGFDDAFGDLAKGSARSIQGVNIGNAFSAAVEEGFISSGGGHAMAGGLSLRADDIDAFSSWLNNNLARFTNKAKMRSAHAIDAALALNAVDLEFADELEKIGPFGVGAPKPCFVFRDVNVSAKRVGLNHLRCNLTDSSGQQTAMAWRVADEPLGQALQSGGKMHIIGNIRIDNWRGKSRAMIELIDAAPS